MHVLCEVDCVDNDVLRRIGLRFAYLWSKMRTETTWRALLGGSVTHVGQLDSCDPVDDRMNRRDAHHLQDNFTTFQLRV